MENAGDVVFRTPRSDEPLRLGIRAQDVDPGRFFAALRAGRTRPRRRGASTAQLLRVGVLLGIGLGSYGAGMLAVHWLGHLPH